MLSSMIVAVRTLLALLFLGLLSASAFAQNNAAAAPAFPGQTEGNSIIKDFHFHTGEVLPELLLHYATLGTPHRNASGEIDNAVLLLHSTGGDTTEFFDPEFSGPLFGLGRGCSFSRRPATAFSSADRQRILA